MYVAIASDRIKFDTPAPDKAAAPTAEIAAEVVLAPTIMNSSQPPPVALAASKAIRDAAVAVPPQKISALNITTVLLLEQVVCQ